jgi:hypothetical protein
MSFLYNAFKNAPAIGKKVFGKSSNKNLTPELEALKGFKVSPSGKKDKTKEYKFNLMQKKLSKNKDEMIKFRNQKSKEIFKNK